MWNLWYFRKVVWNYRNWDYSYSLELFRRGLTPLEKCVRNGHFDNSEQSADEIQRFLDATDDKEFWDVCGEFRVLIRRSWQSRVSSAGEITTISTNTQPLTKEEKERKRILLKRSIKWEEARWKRAVTEFEKLRGWWD